MLERETIASRLHGDMSTLRLRALMLAVMAIVLAACTRSTTVSPTTIRPLPAIDLSATPAGWVPVDYGDAQISVPPIMGVFYPGGEPCASGDTMPAGPTTTMATSGRVCPVEFDTVVRLHLVGPAQLTTRGEKYNEVNGVLVYRRPGDVYYAPSLGIEATANNPDAESIILHTLTRSPRSVAVASGPAPTVPSSWRTVSFAGLIFTAPRSWPVTRTSYNLGIGYPCTVPGVALVPKRGIVLSTDQQVAVYHCPADSPLPLTPQNGVQVDAGTQALSQWWNLHIDFSKGCLVLHGLTACPATSPAYSILILEVTVPGRSKPVYVSIGLAGNGMIARTILYSLKAA